MTTFSVPRTFQPCVRATDLVRLETYLLIAGERKIRDIKRGVGFLLSRKKKHCGKERVDKEVRMARVSNGPQKDRREAHKIRWG